MIQALLNTQEVKYTSHLSEEGLKKKIEDLFKQTSLRMAGKLTSESEFTAYDKRVVIGWSVPNLKRKAAYLKGYITKEKTGTQVKLKVKPNAMLSIFAILSAVIGIVLTTLALTNTTSDKAFLIFGLVFISLSIIYYPVSTLFRNQLRNKLVKQLGLRKA